MRLQQKDNQAMLDLEYVQLNVPKVLALFNKVVPAVISQRRADYGVAVLEAKMIAVAQIDAQDEWTFRFRKIPPVQLP